MKKIIKYIFLLFFSLIVYSCLKTEDEEPGKKPATVDELFDYCQVNIPMDCEDSLNHEGENVEINGYIKKADLIMSDSIFWLYQSAQDYNNNEIKVIVGSNITDIQNKLQTGLAHADNNEYVKVIIRGAINGENLKLTFWCMRKVVLFIDDTSDIDFVKV